MEKHFIVMIKIFESSHREKRKDKKKAAFKNSNNMHLITCTGFYSKGFTKKKKLEVIINTSSNDSRN